MLQKNITVFGNSGQSGIKCGVGSQRKFAIFLVHSTESIFSQQKVPYFSVLQQKMPYFSILQQNIDKSVTAC